MFHHTVNNIRAHGEQHAGSNIPEAMFHPAARARRGPHQSHRLCNLFALCSFAPGFECSVLHAIFSGTLFATLLESRITTENLN
jgi:hypothetical protein